jgi:hypothetical protein
MMAKMIYECSTVYVMKCMINLNYFERPSLFTGHDLTRNYGHEKMQQNERLRDDYPMKY